MGFDGEESHVHGPNGGERIDDAGPRFEFALSADNAYAALLHGVAVPAACKKCNLHSDARHPCAHVGSDGARTGNGKLHPRVPVSAAATLRRCTLPVAVRGMEATM